MNLSDVRRWARENGLPVGDRGRIKPEIVAAFEAAHGSAVETPSRTQEPEKTTYVELPKAVPGLAETYGDDAAAVAKAYVPGANRDDLTDALVKKARDNGAAIVAIGPRLALFKDKPIPSSGAILLDFRKK